VKRISLSVFVSMAMIFVLVGSAIAAADALPGSGWWSGETIQNVGSGDASIDITAYDKDSSSTYGLSDTVSPGANKVYDPTSFAGMPAGFQGSAIVSSNQDIRAIVTVTNRYIASSGLGDAGSPHFAAGIYQGVNIPATTIRFSLAKNNHYNHTTTFFVQNAGSVAATATATFKMPSSLPSGAVLDYTYTTPSIGPGQMAVFTPNDARNAGNPPPAGNGAVGSLTVTSSQPLAGTVLEHFTAETHATLVQATRSATPSDYDTKLFSPNTKNNYYGRFSGLQVQNVSGGNINVNVSYVGSDFQTGGVNCIGQTYLDSHNNLPPGESWTFPSTAIPDKCFASATVTATGNVIGQVNESFTTAYIASTGRYQESTVFSALPGNSATTIISLPLYKEDSFSKATGTTIQNVGSADTHVTITFKGVAGTFVSQPQLIHPGAGLIIIDARLKPSSFWNGTAMTPGLLGCVNSTTGCGANGVFGVIVQSDGQPIVAILNETTYPINAPRIQQDKSAYEGFNLNTAP
jgi:hypothetical protein